MNSGQGTSRAYTLARLKREAPSLHAQVVAGGAPELVAAMDEGMGRGADCEPREGQAGRAKSIN